MLLHIDYVTLPMSVKYGTIIRIRTCSALLHYKTSPPFLWITSSNDQVLPQKIPPPSCRIPLLYIYTYINMIRCWISQESHEYTFRGAKDI